jgi:hypothetical protein
VFAGLLLAGDPGRSRRASDSVIGLVLKIAGYTYGPLLGLFAFAILTRRQITGGWIPVVALAAPILCSVIESRSAAWLGGYRLGNELLLLNGVLTFAGLMALSRRAGA